MADVLGLAIDRAMRKQRIEYLRQFEGKNIGVDFGRPVGCTDEGYPEFPSGCAYAFKLPDGSLLFEESIRHGRLYHGADAAIEGNEEDYRLSQTVVGYSFDCENNAFHAGNFDAQQSALERLFKESKSPKDAKPEDGDSSLSPIEVVLEVLHCMGYRPEDECKEHPECARLDHCGVKQGDALEFVAQLSTAYGLDFSTPLCRKIDEMFSKADYVVIRDLADVIRLVFLEDHLDPSRLMFFNDEGKCKHFEADKERIGLFPDDESFFAGTSQQCLLCRYWCDTGIDGVKDPHIGCLGKCTWRWIDPNGDRQQTFWEEK